MSNKPGRIFCKTAFSRRLFGCVIVFVCLYAQGQLASAQQPAPARPELTGIFLSVRELRESQFVDGIPDYSSSAVEAQKARPASLRAEGRNELGDGFDLRHFHDELLAAAWVPIELTRWEMNGDGTKVQRMIDDRTPMPW